LSTCLRRCPPGPEPADQSMRCPATPLHRGRAAQGEHYARLVRGSEFQADEVREAAAPKSLSHDSIAAHDQGRVSEHTRENTVLGERSSPAIDGRLMTGQQGYASRFGEELRPSSGPFAVQGGPGSSGLARRSRGTASPDPWRRRPARPLPRHIHRGPREPSAGPITRGRIPSESRPHPASPAADIDTGGSTGSGLPASSLARCGAIKKLRRT